MASNKEPMSSHSEKQDESSLISIREGKAEIWVPKTGTSQVFYNPVQEFNRDLSSAALKVYVDNLSKWKRKPADRKEKTNEGASSDTTGNVHKQATSEVTLLEGLSATGLRAVRYALEVDGINNIVANDISKEAFQRIQKNITTNKVENIVTASNHDASLLMYMHRFPVSKRCTVIDLDPYGSAAPFLDSAVQAIDDGGLLMVTCTDMGVLCGNHSDACYGKYGSMSLKAKFCHEMALRILLSSIESHANRYKRYITPLMCVSVDFYIRIFVQVFTSPSEVKRSPSKQSLVYHCVGCGSYHFQLVGRCIGEGSSKKYPPTIGPSVGMTCDQCGSKFHVGGPIWTQPMHDVEYTNKVKELVQSNQDNYKTSQRIIGMLSMVEEELPNSPLYYTLDHLSNVVHCNTPSIVEFRSALLGLGYEVSGSHACGTAIKTTASHSVIWDIMRCWVKEHPVKRKATGSPGTVILEKEPAIQATFDAQAGANPASRKKGLLRFQVNPETNWGPQTRAKRGAVGESQVDKRQRLQGKRKQTKENESSLKKFPCKRFKAGECDLGESCRYSHGTADQETTNEDDSKDIQNSKDNAVRGDSNPNEQTSTTPQEDNDSKSNDEETASSSKDDSDGNKKHFRRHRSIEFQRHHSVTEAEHSLLF